MGRFAKGYKPDRCDYGYKPHHFMVAASSPSLAQPNHVPFRKGDIYQADAGMCTGMGCLKRPTQLWLEMNGFASYPMISGDFAYKIGRAEERADGDPDNLPPLEDAGAEPGLVLLAARSVGVRIETDCPDPSTDPAILTPGVSPWSIGNVNAEPTPDDGAAAYDMAGIEFSILTAAPGQRREQIRDLMCRRVPIPIGLFVDRGVEDNAGALVTHINQIDPQGGGHMVTVLDGTSDEWALLDNWWRFKKRGIDSEWGLPDNNQWGYPAGTWRIAWDIIEHQAVQIFGYKGAPLSLRKAA